MRDNNDTRTFIENRQISYGYRGVANFISENMNFTTVLVDTLDLGGDTGAKTMIFSDTRANIYFATDLWPSNINIDYSKPYESFEQLIMQTNTRAIVLNNHAPSWFRPIIEQYLEKNGYSHRIEDYGAELYILY
jgi:hypothetical protein